ncbi:MAG: hypothetical protein CO141_00150 [Candidatus Moranbacteria bacterium CG_4_9_14_3_um_filter_42_9]|nr:MAG: hypothetical protein CO141_00150 [Candidatus Moranbacteria bacterium CG_4_9_14_3_um_filter_42_9]
MDKTLFTIYKIPFLISLTLAVALLAVGTVGKPFDMAMVIIGSLLGMFALDAEYFLNAYVLETKSEFSRTLINFLKHSDWTNALKHVYYHKDESRENSLNSALFQVILAAMSIFVAFSGAALFAKALILSVFAQSIYVLLEYYFKGRSDDWFWVMANKPTKTSVQLYIVVLFVILSFCLYIF